MRDATLILSETHGQHRILSWMSGVVTEETKFYEKQILSGCFIKLFDQNADTSHSGKAVPTNKKYLILSLNSKMGRRGRKEVKIAICKPCLINHNSFVCFLISPASDHIQTKSARLTE